MKRQLKERKRAMKILEELGGQASASDVAYYTKITTRSAAHILKQEGCIRIKRNFWALPHKWKQDGNQN